jgi:hypothetical protein
MRRSVRLAALLALSVACGPSPAGSEAASPASAKSAAGHEAAPGAPSSATPAANAPSPKAHAMKTKIAQFADATLTADVSRLPASERETLDLLIQASRLLDPIFDRQAYAGNPALREKLAKDTTPEGKLTLEYFDIMRGPWDRQRQFEPFAIATPHPEGAGFYPEDLTKAEFEAYVKAHPSERAALEGLFTVVERDAKDAKKLRAVPYSEAYAEWLKPAADLLVQASKRTKNKTLAKFLASRAKAFASNDYYQSDKDWMDLDSDVEVTIGPYETYEDALLGLKASYESFVTVSDPTASAKLAKYKSLLPAMEANLPIPKEMHTKRGAESPIRVVDLVYSSGDARKSVQTIAFHLPNDEKVRAEKGAKKVMLRNLIEKKFELIMKPIGEKIIAEDQVKYLSSEAFFDETLFHELSHSLGPAFVTKDGKKVEVRVALGADSSTLEETKADVMGAYNVLFMIDKKELPEDLRQKLLVSYFAGLFRSVRFGVAEAHGQGGALQINWFLEKGGARFDEKTGRFTVDAAKLTSAISELVKTICVLQHQGDSAGVTALLAKYGVMSPPMSAALAKLDGIAVDLRPVYPLAETK